MTEIRNDRCKKYRGEDGESGREGKGLTES